MTTLKIKEDQSLEHQVMCSLDNKHLELIILPTEKCNFRCTYCYEDFSKGRMSPDTVSGIKKLLEYRAKNLDSIHLSWFGGEPLLAKDLIVDIMSFSKILEKRNNSLKVLSSMTTNAFLLNKKTFVELLDVGVTNFQISLDGPKNIHNQSRLKANGSGTFDTIWNNLLDMKEVKGDFEITLRLHFDPYSVDYIDELIEQINHAFGQDSRFSCFLKALERLGGPNDSLIRIFDSENQKKKIIEAIAQKLKTNVFRAQSDIPYICYASKPNSIVIRSNGELSKCTVAFNDSRNNVGHINSEGALKINSENFKIWLMGLESFSPKELECPYHFLPMK